MDELKEENIRLTNINIQYDEDIKYFEKIVEWAMRLNEQKYERALKELSDRNECLQLHTKFIIHK